MLRTSFENVSNNRNKKSIKVRSKLYKEMVKEKDNVIGEEKEKKKKEIQ